jgi:replicative DNA helicase
MIVIAARPGVGKTALALTMAKNFIRQRYDENNDRFVQPGYRVGMFSLEMTNEQLMLRLLASMANVSLQRIRKGELRDSDLMALAAVGEEVAHLPIYLDESSMLSISQLRARARRMKQKFNIEVIIIDYLQLLTSTSAKAKDNRQTEVAEISRGIKGLARELGVPVIVLAQLNRRSEEGNADPALHHLRESGSIEQDADMVFLLNRYEDKDGNPEFLQDGSMKVKLIIAKQRSGPIGKVDLKFFPENTRYDTLRSNEKDDKPE